MTEIPEGPVSKIGSLHFQGDLCLLDGAGGKQQFKALYIISPMEAIPFFARQLPLLGYTSPPDRAALSTIRGIELELDVSGRGRICWAEQKGCEGRYKSF